MVEDKNKGNVVKVRNVARKYMRPPRAPQKDVVEEKEDVEVTKEVETEPVTSEDIALEIMQGVLDKVSQAVEDKTKKANNTKGVIEGDLPTKLTKEFGLEIARPAAQIFRKIAKTGKWPNRWKMEHGIPLKKTSEPKSENEVRIISLTPFLSKIFERVVADWLLKFISDKLDINQYGGRKGSSTSHYLIDFISFILYNQDLPESEAVLTAMVDYQKAFNRQDHSTLVTLLGDMGVPGWLLHIVIGFLSERELVVTYKGAKSARKAMPGGGPQGTILGMLLFLVLINSAGFSEDNRTMGTRVTQAANARKAMTNIHLKYIDDLTIAESLKLKVVLEVDKDKEWERPLNYNERFEQTLVENNCQVQDQLNKIAEHATENKMKINLDKTKIMLFNQSNKYDFKPELGIEGVQLEVVNKMKLLGVVITDDLKWDENTDFITKKAFSRLWLLRRLKKLGASKEALLDIYAKNVRSVVEYASVVWHSALTKKNTAQIERVQKAVFAIILGEQYNSYQAACSMLQMKMLSERRVELARKFALKASQHHIHREWFVPNVRQTNTRQKQLKYKPAQARTNRFLKSAIPFLTQCLNQE